MRCSKDIFKQLSQQYLKFRNTARYCLGNLDGFDPENLVSPADMPELDRFAMTRLNRLIEKCEAAYKDYEFHTISHAVNDFCILDLSSFYLDIIKDRLYCEARDGVLRRSAQTVMYLVLDTITKIFAPILAFTCNEIWLSMPHRGDDDVRNVLLNEMNSTFSEYELSGDAMAKWDTLIKVRGDVNGVLETARAEKRIGKALEAHVSISAADDDARAALKAVEGLNLSELLIVSSCEIGSSTGDVCGEGGAIPGLRIAISQASGEKCPRCWMHTKAPDEDGLCPRCSHVLKK